MLVASAEGRSKAGAMRVKVLDFGIAKMSQETEGSLRTETGATIGTPAYMAPEQCLSAPNVDGKADVYALGIILYELLSGRLPFTAQHSFDFMAAHVRSEPRSLSELLPDLPPEVDNLVHSMLVKDPALRPSMETVASLLQELQAAGPALWAADPLHATELGPAAREQSAHAATLSQPPRPVRHSKELIEISATAPGLAGARFSRDIAPIAAPPSSQISGRARISQDAASSGPRALAASSPQNPAEPSLAHEGLASSQILPVRSDDPALAARATTPRIAAALLVALALAGGAWAVLRLGASASNPSASTGTSAAHKPAAAPTVKWLLRTQPAGAEVVRSDGQVIGSTPLQLARPADSGESQITLRLPGFVSKTVVFSHSTDVETDIVLMAQPAAQPSPALSATAAPSPTSEDASRGSGKTGGKRGRKASGKRKPAGSDDVKLLMD